MGECHSTVGSNSSNIEGSNKENPAATLTVNGLTEYNLSPKFLSSLSKKGEPLPHQQQTQTPSLNPPATDALHPETCQNQEPGPFSKMSCIRISTKQGDLISISPETYLQAAQPPKPPSPQDIAEIAIEYAPDKPEGRKEEKGFDKKGRIVKYRTNTVNASNGRPLIQLTLMDSHSNVDHHLDRGYSNQLLGESILGFYDGILKMTQETDGRATCR